MQKNSTNSPQIHLKTRKSQPISQKIRDDFYTFDSQPRFFLQKKLYLPEKRANFSKSPLQTRNPATFDQLFLRTSPDGFSQHSRKKSPVRNSEKETPNTPKFRGKKRVPGFSQGFSEKLAFSEAKVREFEDFSQRTGKKVLRLDRELDSVEKVRGFYKKFCAYKNLSNVFQTNDVRNAEKATFVTEYGGSFRSPSREAYRNELSPFRKL